MAVYIGVQHDQAAVRTRRTRSIFLAVAFGLLFLIYSVRVLAPHSPPAFTMTNDSYQPSLHATNSRQAANIAVIIEGRPLTSIAPLLLHFASILGPSWLIVLYITPAVSSTIPNSAPFLRALRSRAIQLRLLPEDITFNVREDVSAFLTSPWLWQELAPAPHVLLFQADSILCSNSEQRIEDFLHYDFVGAPISTSLGHGDMGMNGGLSLRNRTLMMNITTRFNWAEEKKLALDPNSPPVVYEDQWFYAKMQLLNREAAAREDWDGMPIARLPSMEQAMLFSVETVWYDKPLGYHQVPRWHWDRVAEIDKWCPEHRIAISEVIHE